MQPRPSETPMPHRPSLGQGRPSAVKTAGAGIGTILLILIAVAAVMAAIVVVASYAADRGAHVLDPKADLKVVARDLRPMRDRSGGLVYLAELENVGPKVDRVSATLRLFNTQHTEIGRRPCSLPIRGFGHASKLPCALSFGAVADPASVSWSFDLKPPIEGVEEAALDATATLARKGGTPATYAAEGSVKNTSSFAAHRVVAMVTLYDGQGKITGAAVAALADIPPGGTGALSVPVLDVAALPVRAVAAVYGSKD